MYELIQVSENCYYIESPARIGLVRLNETDVCLIDSGSDKDAGRKVRQHLDKNDWRLTAIYNTHSNADHVGGNQYLLNIVVVAVLTILMYVYLNYSKHGYEIAVVGDSENTARYAGIRVPRIYVRTMALSGALCGFAGFLAVSAVSHTLSTSTAGGRGFTAIIVAWLAKMNPFVMILISALLSFLDKGAVQIASDFGLNEYVSQIISGVILFFILGSEFFINYQVKAGGKHK